MANRIDWDNDEEVERLKELVDAGKDWPEVAKILNKEFKGTRPKDENNKPLKRSHKSCFWYHQRLTRKEREEKGEVVRRPRRKGSVAQSSVAAPDGTYRINVTDDSGTTVAMITTTSSIGDIMSALKEVF